MSENPMIARCEALVADGLHPTAVRVSAAGRGRWTLAVTLDDMTSPEEAGDPRFLPVDRKSLPAGVTAFGWVRFPDDVSEVRGSAEAVEAWMTELARVGRSPDWARFDPVGGAPTPGYPAYLTRPSRWLRPNNPARKAAELGRRVRQFRERAGLTVQELAESAGLTRQAVHNYESGARRPTWDAVQKLAAALGVSTDVFRD